MIRPIQEQTAANWAQGMGQAARRAAETHDRELGGVTRALDEALVEDDRAEILAQFGRAVVLFAQQGRWHAGLAAAREVYNAAARWSGFDAVPYALTVAQFAHNYAIELQRAGLSQAAEDFYAEALSLFQAYGDVKRALVTEHELGRAQQDQGKYAAAEMSYFASLAAAREHSAGTYVARNLFQLGQLAHLTGQFEKSAELYIQVLALAESLHSAPLLSAAAHQLGILAQTRGEYGEARNWFERAVEPARQSGDARSLSDALHHLGMVAHEQGDYERAAELYHASLAEADDTVDTAPTLYQLAQLAQARGELASAEAYARQSQSLLQGQGDLANIKRVQDLVQRVTRQRVSVA